MIIRFLAVAIVAGSLFFVSCSKNETIPMSDVNVNIQLPSQIENTSSVRLSKATLTLSNTNTNIDTKQELSSLDNILVNVEDGVYNITLSGEISYTITTGEGENMEIREKTSLIKGLQQNINIVGGSFDISMNLSIYNKKNGFVISEVFFSGTKTPEGARYFRDQYIEIYNNSDKTLYADGLCIAQTAFHCNWPRLFSELTPDLRSTRTVIDAVYRIPGAGQEHPVEPGERILIADIAKNHQNDNPNSFDLSMADFEWVDQDDQDVDVAEVANMEKIYSTSRSIYIFHMAGLNSFVLFRMDKDADTFINENTYDYSYLFQFRDISRTFNKSGYDIPNESIIDAVGCATEAKHLWNVLDPSLDFSWTHSGNGDEDSVGKCIKRKVASTKEDGREVLLDTNDSSFDFEATAQASPGEIK